MSGVRSSSQSRGYARLAWQGEPRAAISKQSETFTHPHRTLPRLIHCTNCTCLSLASPLPSSHPAFHHRPPISSIRLGSRFTLSCSLEVPLSIPPKLGKFSLGQRKSSSPATPLPCLASPPPPSFWKLRVLGQPPQSFQILLHPLSVFDLTLRNIDQHIRRPLIVSLVGIDLLIRPPTAQFYACGRRPSVPVLEFESIP